MKFDVVITNPPYQDSSHNEKKNTLWRKFIELSQNYTKVGGYSSLLIPSSWMGSKKLLNEFFLDKDIIYINKDECKRHFPGVGSNFSYYVKKIMHADEPNHGIILGVDKPRIVLEDGKYYSGIIDKTLETFITDIPNIELFY